VLGSFVLHGHWFEMRHHAWFGLYFDRRLELGPGDLGLALLG